MKLRVEIPKTAHFGVAGLLNPKPQNHKPKKAGSFRGSFANLGLLKQILEEQGLSMFSFQDIMLGLRFRMLGFGLGFKVFGPHQSSRSIIGHVCP